MGSLFLKNKLVIAFFFAAVLLVPTVKQVGAEENSSIIVTTPSGGQTFAIGESVSVQWESLKEFNSFNIILEKDSEYAGNQMWNLSGDSFHVVWSPRDYLMERVNLGARDGYRLAVCGFIEEEMECGYSGEFSIENDEAPSCTVSYREYAVNKAAFPTGEWIGCDEMSVTFTGFDIEKYSSRVVGSSYHWNEIGQEWSEVQHYETSFLLWALHSGPGYPVVLVRTAPVPAFSRASSDMHVAHGYAQDGINNHDVFVGTPSFRKLVDGETPIYLMEIAVERVVSEY